MGMLCLQTGEGDSTDIDSYVKSYILLRSSGGQMLDSALRWEAVRQASWRR